MVDPDILSQPPPTQPKNQAVNPLQPTKCDEYAASAYDTRLPRHFKVVAYSKIDVVAAEPACREALRADPNSARIQFHLARTLQRANKRVEAKEYAQRAAGQNYPIAMTLLGDLLKPAVRLPPSPGQPDPDVLALSWYTKAAELGDSMGMGRLGDAYRMGVGVSRDDARALHWYRRSADAGFDDSMSVLGWMYRTGRGVPIDLAQSFKWYLAAADLGDPEAMNAVGEFYRDGLSSTPDTAKAKHWFEKGSARGNKNAAENLRLFSVTKDDTLLALKDLYEKQSTCYRRTSNILDHQYSEFEFEFESINITLKFRRVVYRREDFKEFQDHQVTVSFNPAEVSTYTVNNWPEEGTTLVAECKGEPCFNQNRQWAVKVYVPICNSDAAPRIMRALTHLKQFYVPQKKLPF